LDFNAILDAGFRGVRVSLTVQLDDDEQPDLTKDVRCEAPSPVGEAPPAVDWLCYYDADKADMKQVPGRIDDTTARLTRSGVIRFTVPLNIGPIPTWNDMRPTSPQTALEACLEMGTVMQATLKDLDPLGTLTVGNYGTVLDAGV